MQEVLNLLFNTSSGSLYDDDGEVKRCEVKPEEILLDFPTNRREVDKRRKSITKRRTKGSTQGRSLKAYQVPNLRKYNAQKFQPDLEKVSFEFKSSRGALGCNNDNSSSTLSSLEPFSDGF